jgi:hypothetical protein
MSTLTATMLKKMLATAEGDCRELEKAIALHLCLAKISICTQITLHFL